MRIKLAGFQLVKSPVLTAPTAKIVQFKVLRYWRVNLNEHTAQTHVVVESILWPQHRHNCAEHVHACIATPDAFRSGCTTPPMATCSHQTIEDFMIAMQKIRSDLLVFGVMLLIVIVSFSTASNVN